MDSYDINFERLSELNASRIPIVCFDDTGDRILPVDLVINGSPSSQSMNYSELGPQNSLLGPSYQIIRSDLNIRESKTKNLEPKNLFISIGGSDPLDIRQSIASFAVNKICQNWPRLKVNMVVGPLQQKFLAEKHHNFTLHFAPKNYPTLLANSNLAISAGGQTLFELASCGVPTLAFAVGDDQLPNLRALNDLNAIKYIGRALNQNWLQNLFNGISDLMENSEIRLKISKNASKIIDGKGSARIADAIKSLGVGS